MSLRYERERVVAAIVLIYKQGRVKFNKFLAKPWADVKETRMTLILFVDASIRCRNCIRTEEMRGIKLQQVCRNKGMVGAERMCWNSTESS